MFIKSDLCVVKMKSVIIAAKNAIIAEFQCSGAIIKADIAEFREDWQANREIFVLADGYSNDLFLPELVYICTLRVVNPYVAKR